MGFLIKLLIPAAAILIFAVIKRQNAAQVARQDAEGACLSCFSTRTEISGDTATCQDCGFSFAADRGGKLTEKEMASLYEP